VFYTPDVFETSSDNPVEPPSDEEREAALARQATATQREPPRLSILIPTHNRQELLLRTLTELKRQCTWGPDAVEVVVVNDGSIDETAEMLARFDPEARYAFHTFTLEKAAGPAVARNTGLRHVRGLTVLIMGDDVVPSERMVERHLAWHEEHPEPEAALLGRVGWPEELKPDPFMCWLEEGGRKFFFNYLDLPRDKPVAHDFFYTANVSLKRALIEQAGGFFEETFPFASHEDLEFGYRLGQAGMRLFYDPDTFGYHWHWLDLRGTARRIYIMGYSSLWYWAKVPDPSNRLRKISRWCLVQLGASRCAHRLLCMLIRRAENQPDGEQSTWGPILHLCYWCGAGDSRRQRDAGLFAQELVAEHRT
jgi:glycosyltransferase involved in cell wall biosynthesis